MNGDEKSELPDDLVKVIQVWDDLPDAVRKGINAMVVVSVH